MNRFTRESAPPIRRRKPGAAAQLLLRRGEAKDESLDLFSAIRRNESPTISSSSSSYSVAAAEEGELGRRSGVDDDLFYVDVGKSDYDWLLTPPGTPLFSTSEQSRASAKSASSVRSAASAKKPSSSRLSLSSPPQIDTAVRSGRTGSAASSSASSSNCTSSTPLSTAKPSLLTRSSPSVTSKPSPPLRPTTMRPVGTPASTRLPSPARSRHKPSPPSTPITRPRAPSTASTPRTVAPASRPNPPRQSTPARSTSVGRTAGAPARAAVQPDAMSKIKTKPTERPQSTGKQRSVTPASSNRGRIQENSTKKASNTAIRISAKPSSPVESNGFGRNISKKSLDVAVRHTDIRQGAGGIRGASLFPHSIRSTAAKSRQISTTNKVALPTTTTTADNRLLDRAASECGSSTNGTISGERTKTEASVSGDSTTATTSTTTKSQERKFTAAARVSELDLYGISTRYDTMLLKEDARDLNWLRSVDDVSAESPTFHRFEPLPEPFGLV